MGLIHAYYLDETTGVVFNRFGFNAAGDFALMYLLSALALAAFHFAEGSKDPGAPHA